MINGKWSKVDEAYLLENYKEMMDSEIAKHLNRNELSVRNKRMKLGIKKYDLGDYYIECQNCSKEFRVSKSRLEQNPMYCSMKCKTDSIKIKKNKTILCKNCDTKFTVIQSSKKIFCSHSCALRYRDLRQIIKCANCDKEVLKQNHQIEKRGNLFCNPQCHNEYQTGDKIEFICKICGKIIYEHPSMVKHRGERKYCSIICRNADPEHNELLIQLNHLQNKNKKKNKLELAGATILKKMDISFKEQVLINNKICVDILLDNTNIIIEWWGEYWHGHPSKLKDGQPDRRQKKRMALDKSQRKYLEKCGYVVISFWETDVTKRPEIVEVEIKKVLSLINDETI